MQVELLDRKKWNARLERASAMSHHLEVRRKRQRLVTSHRVVKLEPVVIGFAVVLVEL